MRGRGFGPPLHRRPGDCDLRRPRRPRGRMTDDLLYSLAYRDFDPPYGSLATAPTRAATPSREYVAGGRSRAYGWVNGDGKGREGSTTLVLDPRTIDDVSRGIGCRDYEA